jgi:hypothetical protein
MTQAFKPQQPGRFVNAATSNVFCQRLSLSAAFAASPTLA